MLHFYYFISRKSSLSKVAFHNYWKDTHGPIAKEIPQLQRYIQSHQIPDVGFECGFDGVAEGWVENFSSLEELRSSREYLSKAQPCHTTPTTTTTTTTTITTTIILLQ